MGRDPKVKSTYSKELFERDREAASSNPGEFHGNIAKREIYWYVEKFRSWCKIVDEKWKGVSAENGAQVREVAALPLNYSPWEKAFNDSKAPYYGWFDGGQTNACFNEVDIHVIDGCGSEIAFIFEGEELVQKDGGKSQPKVLIKVSRDELLSQVAKSALILKNLGLKKGDRIVFNMPNMLEHIYFIEAAKRLGVIYTCVFGGLNAKSVAERIVDTNAKIIITVDNFLRSGIRVNAKSEFVDKALDNYFVASEVLKQSSKLFSHLGIDFEKDKKFLLAWENCFENEIIVEKGELTKNLISLIGTFTGKPVVDENLIADKMLKFLEEPCSMKVDGVVIVHDASEKIAGQRARDRSFHELTRELEAGHREISFLFKKLSGIDLVTSVNKFIPPVPVRSDFPLFIAYTSGSTGKPKGIVHTHGGYVLGIAHTMKLVFGAEPGKDIIYSVADPGWITGQSYMICAPLVSRVASVICGGGPLYPYPTRFAEVIERHSVTIFKAGSTFLRSVAAEPKSVESLGKCNLSTLKAATFCAEPVSPVLQEFGMKHITSRYINSYWATEHGGMVLTHFYGGDEDFPLKPDAHTIPLAWISADVWVREKEFKIEGVTRHEFRKADAGEKGEIVITKPYPYLARTMWGNAEKVLDADWVGDIKKFSSTYFENWAKAGSHGQIVEWVYTQGDFASRNEDMSFSFHGRSDEVINTSGHRIGTEEIESAILKDKKLNPFSPVANVVVVGAPDEERGSIPVAFILLTEGASLGHEDELRLSKLVESEKGEVAIPGAYISVHQLPETRSGKYMRRYIKALINEEQIGDTSTLRNPESITEIESAIESWKSMVKLNAKTLRLVAEGELPKAIEDLNVEKKREYVTEYIGRLISRVLGLNSNNSVDFSRPLREMGVDSLKTLNFTNCLRKALGSKFESKINPTMIFNYPTGKAIVDYLAKEVLKFERQENAQRSNLRRRADDPIAIVGMACRYPGGINSPEDFWDLLIKGTDAIGDIPGDRWSVEKFYDANRDTPGKMIARRGGFLKNVDLFDPQFFGITPDEAKALDPQHRLLLEVSWEAMERSAISPESLFGSDTGVYVGITTREYAELVLNSVERDDLEVFYPTGTNLNTASGRISYTLGLNGPSVSVDTACSSSLVAIHLACQAIRDGSCETAFAGGVNVMLTPPLTVCFSRMHALSVDAKCKTFDESANGYVRSEGCGVVVLKRLSSAIRDGNHILALVKGSGVNQDGRSSSLTAPNGLAQASLVRSVLENSGVKPAEVDYIEAHGTGTPLGDPIELNALGSVLKEGRPKENRFWVGSAKTNIGHAESAAGVAGLIKTVMCLQHREIPGILHFKKINPHIPLEEIPAQIPTKLISWSKDSGKRYGGVSSFGLSGTNAHILLEEAPDVEKRVPSSELPSYLLCLSAKSDTALLELAKKYLVYLRSNSEVSLADVCYTANTSRGFFNHRAAFVGNSKGEMEKKLQAFTDGKIEIGVSVNVVSPKSSSKIAFLFTGQGSQYVGMAKKLYETQPTFRDSIDQCNDILKEYLKKPLTKVLFDPSESETLLNETLYIHSAICALEYAFATLWRSWGIEPNFLMGHSLGEFAAAAISGAQSIEDIFKLIVKRVELAEANKAPFKMAAVSAGADVVGEAISGCLDKVSIAALNGPENTVISGDLEKVLELLKNFGSKGYKTKQLATSWAGHSVLTDPIVERYKEVGKGMVYNSPKIPLISNVTGKRVDEGTLNAKYWSDHLRKTVRFSDGMKSLFAEGVQYFIEMGPGSVLLGMGQLSAADETETGWFPSIRHDRDDWDQMLESLGALFTRGIKIDWTKIDIAKRSFQNIPTYPFQRKRFWVNPKDEASVVKNVGKNSQPLLESHFPSAKDYGYFETVLSVASYPYLKEHEVYGMIIVPASLFIETILEVSNELFGNGPVTLKDFSFERALKIQSDQKKKLQVVVEGKAKGAKECFVEIYSSSEESGTSSFANWTLHVRGKIELPTARLKAIDGSIALGEFQKRCSITVPPTTWYSSLDQIGLKYGWSFRNMTTASKGNGVCLGKLKMGDREDLKVSGYKFHPAILDTCLQVSSIYFSHDGKADKFYFPVGFDELTLLRPAMNEVWCGVEVKADETNDQSVKADLSFTDKDGAAIGKIKGFTSAVGSKEALLNSVRGQDTLSNCFYRSIWKTSELGKGSLAELPKDAFDCNWLILNDEEKFGDLLAERLRAHCGSAKIAQLRLNADSQGDDFESTFSKAFDSFDSRPLRVVHLWGIKPGLEFLNPQTLENGNQGLFVRNLKVVYNSSLSLVRAILKSKWSEKSNITFLTRGAQSIDGESCAFLQAPIWGLGKVIDIEHPNLQCVRIDLDPDSKKAEQDLDRIIIDLILREESEILYRNGARKASRLSPVSGDSIGSVDSNAISIRGDATYLISGGTNGLGLEVAKSLVENGARNLALIGRREPPESASKEIAKLKDLDVNVRVFLGDVGIESDVKKIIEGIKGTMPEIRGVIHAAGTVADGVIEEQDWARFYKVAEPKVLGVWNLHRNTCTMRLDFFNCFSSATSLFGNFGQANYAAANAMLDSFMQYRNSIKLAGQSINWGPWDSVGMVSRFEAEKMKQLGESGLEKIPLLQGMQVFRRLIQNQKYSVGVAMVNWERFVAALPRGYVSRFFSDLSLSHTKEKEKVGSSESDIMTKLKAANGNERLELLQAFIADEVAQVLGLDSGKSVNVKDKLRDLGIDSLRAIAVRNRLKNQFGTEVRKAVPATLLFSFPTIESISSFLVEEVLDLPIEESNVEESSDELDQVLAELAETMSESELAALIERQRSS